MNRTVSMIDRDTEWTTLGGRKIPIKDLTKIHLANVIHNVKEVKKLFPQFTAEYEELLDVLYREAQLRNITKDFLDAAPYPWQDENGAWRIGTDDVCGYKFVQKG
jgi:2-hydroxy-3-keto-5-methylthiopentenyl-1-phosphate phosphatase